MNNKTLEELGWEYGTFRGSGWYYSKIIEEKHIDIQFLTGPKRVKVLDMAQEDSYGPHHKKADFTVDMAEHLGIETVEVIKSEIARLGW